MIMQMSSLTNSNASLDPWTIRFTFPGPRISKLKFCLNLNFR